MEPSEIVFVLLQEATKAHKITNAQVEAARILYNGKPYSSEAYFNLIIAEQNHLVAYRLLQIIEDINVLSTTLKAFVVSSIRSIINTSPSSLPDPLENISDAKLVEFFAILLKSYIQPAHIGRLVELALAGKFDTPNNEMVNAIARRVRQAIRDGISDQNFDNNESLLLADLWNHQQNFIYNRTSSAQFAIDLSVRNFQTFDINDNNTGFPQLSTDVTHVEGKVDRLSSRDYSGSLNHRPGGTGSSIYISECILAGGIPMTVDLNADPTENDCPPQPTTPPFGIYTQFGWRICDNTATSPWRNHVELISYYTNDSGGLGGEQLSNINADDIVDVIYQSGAQAGQLKDNADAEDTLTTLISEKLSSLQAGDYVYVEPLSGDTHGFLMVGWGPLYGVLDGIDYALNNPLSLYYKELKSNHVIPYVADFSFGTKNSAITGTPSGPSRDSDNSDERTGWLQDPRPRPFYTTRVLMSNLETTLRSDQTALLRTIFLPALTQIPQGGETKVIAHQEFNAPSWQFYRLPDHAVIPQSRIYTGIGS